jgi:hypothetical protein
MIQEVVGWSRGLAVAGSAYQTVYDLVIDELAVNHPEPGKSAARST